MQNNEPKENIILDKIKMNSSNAMRRKAKSAAAGEGTSADEEGSNGMTSGLSKVII